MSRCKKVSNTGSCLSKSPEPGKVLHFLHVVVLGGNKFILVCKAIEMPLFANSAVIAKKLLVKSKDFY